MRLPAITCLAVLSACTAASQTAGDSGASFFNKKNLSLAAVSSVGAITIVDSYFMWWKDNYKPFTFYDLPNGWLDEPGSLGIDKVGHLYTSYFFFRTNENVLKWGGYSDESSKWISAGVTAGLALLIEIGDGFSDYGFDYRDLVFNMAGLGFGFFQAGAPGLQNFQLKWSYVPENGLTFPPRFTEHYDSHIYWLSYRFHDRGGHSFLGGAKEFISPAVGFSVGDGGTRREFIAGLDFNLDALFSSEDENWHLLTETLKLIHLPAPGVKFSPGKPPEYAIFLLR